MLKLGVLAEATTMGTPSELAPKGQSKVMTGGLDVVVPAVPEDVPELAVLPPEFVVPDEVPVVVEPDEVPVLLEPDEVPELAVPELLVSVAPVLPVGVLVPEGVAPAFAVVIGVLPPPPLPPHAASASAAIIAAENLADRIDYPSNDNKRPFFPDPTIAEPQACCRRGNPMRANKKARWLTPGLSDVLSVTDKRKEPDRSGFSYLSQMGRHLGLQQLDQFWGHERKVVWNIQAYDARMF